MSTASRSARSAASPAWTPATRSRRRCRIRSFGWWSSWRARSGARPEALHPSKNTTRKTTNMRWTLAILAPVLGLALAPAMSSSVVAQDESYPTHPVRLIAPSGPGGNPDVLARLLADKFTIAFGKPFIVENVPGAGGIVAANLVAKAPPDCHVLMFGDSGAFAINPALNPNMSYDPIKDFTPIAALVSLPTIMVANPAVPA